MGTSTRPPLPFLRYDDLASCRSDFEHHRREGFPVYSLNRDQKRQELLELLLADHAGRVEVETNKSTYALGEPIRFTATLRNRGTTALYISKSFSQAGGGIAGFYVSVKQLTGKPAGGACEGNGDRYMDKDSRTPEQILREDYLALPPGAMVGFETQYRGCVVQPAHIR